MRIHISNFRSSRSDEAQICRSEPILLLTRNRIGGRVCDPQQLRRAERAPTQLKRLEPRTLLRVTDPRSVRYPHAAPFGAPILLTSASTRQPGSRT